MELWDAYNEAGEKLGFDLIRGEKIPEGVYHLVCDVVVRNRDGEFLLMRRSWEKEVYPGSWEIGAGGSAIKGEEPLIGACRELFEETGIEAAGGLKEIYRRTHREHHAIYYGYLLVTDWLKDGIVLQEGETIAYRWVSAAELMDLYDNGSVCSPSYKERLQEYMDSVRKELLSN